MLNKVQVIGRLGRDPEIRYAASGDAIANLTLATTETWKNQQGERQEKTEWHRVVVFGKLAEIVGEYLRKGALAYFEGKLQTRKWTGQDGKDNYTTEIVVDSFSGSMKMLGGKDESQGGSGGQQQQRQAAPQQQQQRQQPTQTDNLADMDDDIPF